MKNTKRIASYLRSPWSAFVFALKPAWGSYFFEWLLSLVGNSMGFLLPYLFKIITNKVSVAGGLLAPNDFKIFSILIAVILLVREITFRVGHILETRVATRVIRHLNNDLFEDILRRPSSYFENRFSGDLGRRVEQISTAVVYFIEQYPWQVSWFAGTFLMTLVLLGTVNHYVLYTFFAWLLFFMLSSVPLLRWHHHASKELAASHARLSGNLVDVFGNVPVVHAFGRVPYEQKYNDEVLREVVSSERKVRIIEIYNKGHQGLSIVLLGTSLSVVSMYLATQGLFSVGDFVLVASIIPTVSSVVWNFGDSVIRAARSFGQIADALDYLRREQLYIHEGKATHLPSSFAIGFEGVSFRYPNSEKSVFEDFSLAIGQGERVGIVGPSGAGKSTLVKLLLRQYEPQQGDVRIGGVPIQEFTLNAYHNFIGYVPQDTSLFHRTLLQNIRYAKPEAAREEVIEASKRAHAHEFIEALPEKYDTTVGERGIKLSGGQRQRIALARAILKNAPILLLDEATSALDSESEALIQEGFSKLFRDRTVIAIAHRLSTLRNMDRIIVLADKGIVEDGSPEELLARPGSFFKRMWEQQKNGFI